MHAAPTARRARLGRALLALVGLFALALVGAEVYLRRTIHPPASASFPFVRPALHRSVAEVTRPVLGLTPRRVVVRANALGLRGDDLDLADRRPLRVVTLGGSVTECLLLDDADTWPRRLQDVLGARTRRPVWVGNAGRSGEMTLDYIAHARVLLPALAPDLVIVMPGGNDLQAAVEDRLLPMDLTDPSALARYSARLYSSGDAADLNASYLAFWLGRRFSQPSYDFAPLYERMARRRREARPLDALPQLEDALDVYRANLSQLVAALGRIPTRPRVVFLTHPAIWKPEMSARELGALWAGYTCMQCDRPEYYSPRALAEALQAFNRELIAVSARAGVPCYDLASRLPKTLDVFYDDAHLREEGARLVANVVGNFVTSQGLLHR
jgi:lysophospholipase L1-like esterase